MKLILAAATLGALAACGSSVAGGKEAETQALIAALEADVPLPDSTRPLSGYERYYSVSEGRIEAVYVESPGGTGRVRLVGAGKLPQPQAEGCSVVNLVFDRANQRFERVLCGEVRLAEAEPDLKTLTTPPSRGERG